MRRVHATVRGLVQGVGYRYSLLIVAEQAGVSGWVRNRDDGSVETQIEGEPQQVDTVLAWLSEGPPGARVDSWDVSDLTPTGDLGFEIR